MFRLLILYNIKMRSFHFVKSGTKTKKLTHLAYLAINMWYFPYHGTREKLSTIILPKGFPVGMPINSIEF